jgi:hypothetical protein
MDTEHKIIVCEGDYDREFFYGKMGRFFAEDKYKRLLPYIRNEPDRVWFLIEEDNRVIAFASLRVNKKSIAFTTEYVEDGFRRGGLFKLLTEARFDYCDALKQPIRASTNLEYLKDYYVRKGFEIYRTTKTYWFLIKESKKRKKTNGKGPAS